MAKKSLLPGMLVIVLIVGMAVVGCGEGDTWSPVTSLMQLNGTWKGSTTQSNTESGITIKTTVVTESKFTASSATNGTMSGTVDIKMTFSGKDADLLYLFMKYILSFESGWSFDDKTRTATYAEIIPPTPVTIATVTAAGIMINQTGNKIKIEVDAPDEVGVVEVILVKQ